MIQFYNSINNTRLVNRPGAALAILFGTFFFFMCIFSLISGLLIPRIENQTTAIRIATLFQEIFLFIFPALLTAVLSTRLPATLLCIDKRPRLDTALLILGVLIASIPAMNCIIEWNANIHLPDGMEQIEQTLRNLEDTAQNATTLIFGNNTTGSLIVVILIVGIMAGLSEELFFRGAFQNILHSTRINRHIAVWIAATVFSFMHFQFFGFIPRLLLGAFFGYVLLWGNNLWYCIIAHAANNIMAVISMKNIEANSTDLSMNTIGQSTNSAILQVALVITSIIVTALIIIKLKRQLNKTT